MAADPEKIYEALNTLMETCGFSGEGGTEQLFAVLSEATQTLELGWDNVVGQSHRDGVGYNVNAWLANTMASILESQKKSES